MSKFMEAVGQLQNKISKEDFEKVADEITSIKMEYESLEKKEYGNFKDSVNRKERIEKLETELKTISDERDKFKTEFENSKDQDKVAELEKELEEYKGKYSSYVEETNSKNKKEFMSYYEKISTHANFDKVKDKIKIVMKEDKIDFDAIEADDINSNLSKLKEYSELGLFGDISTKIDVTPSARVPAKKDIYSKDFG